MSLSEALSYQDMFCPNDVDSDRSFTDLEPAIVIEALSINYVSPTGARYS